MSSQVKEEEIAQKEEEAEEERARKKAAKRREVPTLSKKIRFTDERRSFEIS